jgi:hypothetical protein
MVTIGEREIVDALQRELTARYSLEGDLKLSLSQDWKPLELRNGRDWKLVIDQAPLGGLSSRSQVRFHIESGGNQVGSWQEILRASLWRPVWVATRRLDRGATPDASSCGLKNIDTLAKRIRTGDDRKWCLRPWRFIGRLAGYSVPKLSICSLVSTIRGNYNRLADHEIGRRHG